jgi:hypothetical protein
MTPLQMRDDHPARVIPRSMLLRRGISGPNGRRGWPGQRFLALLGMTPTGKFLSRSMLLRRGISGRDGRRGWSGQRFLALLGMTRWSVSFCPHALRGRDGHLGTHAVQCSRDTRQTSF